MCTHTHTHMCVCLCIRIYYICVYMRVSRCIFADPKPLLGTTDFYIKLWINHHTHAINNNNINNW